MQCLVDDDRPNRITDQESATAARKPIAHRTVRTSPLGCVDGPEELRLNSGGPRRSW